MKSSPEFESIKNIPGVLPEHPYEYFRDLNNRDWQRATEGGRMFTFYYGDVNLSLNSVIEYFCESCRNIQMAPSDALARGRCQSSEDYQKHYYATASRQRSDEIEYALMQKEFAQNELDRALGYTYLEYGKEKKNNHNIMRAATRLIHITGGESTPETLKELLGDDFRDECNIYPFNQSNFRKDFNDHMRLLASDALSDANTNGTMTDLQAKIISFYLTEGETSDLQSLRSDFLERARVFPGGVRLTISDIKRLYPKNTELAA